MSEKIETVNNAVACFNSLPESGDGKYTLKIIVGGITCALKLIYERHYNELKERYAKFLLNDPTDVRCDINIDVFAKDEWDSSSFPAIDVHHINNKHYAFRWDFHSEFDTITGNGRFLSIPDTNILTIDSFVRISYSLMVVLHGGFLIHSAAILRNGNAFLFSGVSDAGKTTVSRISMAENKVLTDEISLVKPSAGEYIAYGTPFWGELQHGLPDSGALKGIMFLQKDTDVYLSKLNRKKALRKLMTNVLFFAKDENLSSRLFSICCEAVTLFDSFDLHFLPDNSFWRCIDEQYSEQICSES